MSRGRPTASRLTPGAIWWRLAGSGFSDHADLSLSHEFQTPSSTQDGEKQRPPICAAHLPPSAPGGGALTLAWALLASSSSLAFAHAVPSSRNLPFYLAECHLLQEALPGAPRLQSSLLSQPHSRPQIHSKDHPTMCLPYYLTRTPRLLSPSSGLFSAPYAPHPWASWPPFLSQRPPPLILIYLGSTGPSLLAQDSGSVLGGHS